MHKLLLPLLSAFFLVACGGSEAGGSGPSLEGTWKIDPTFVDEMLAEQKVPPASRPMAKAMMEQISMTFKDGSFTGTSPTGNDSGTYKITNTDGNKLTVETTSSKGKTESAVITIDGDTMSGTFEKQTMRFTRVK